MASSAGAAGPDASRIRLIVNCDDFGSTWSANEGVERALSEGIATSATVMVPCAWGYDAVLRACSHPEWGVGVHLTHTAEWPRYRWRPLLPRERVPGLYGPDGFMWPNVQSVYAHATPEEALAEGAAQITQAVAWGLAPTHLDTHMGVLQLHPAYFDVYLALAERFRLPLRMAGERQVAAAVARFPWAAGLRERAAGRGIRFHDAFFYGSSSGTDEEAEAHVVRTLGEVPAGISEILFHPAADGADLRAMIPGGGGERVRDLRLLTENAAVRRALAERGIELVSFRVLAGA